MIQQFGSYRPSDARPLPTRAAFLCSLNWGVITYPDHPCDRCGVRAWIKNPDSGRFLCDWCHPSAENIRAVHEEKYGWPSEIDTILALLRGLEDGILGLTANELAVRGELDIDWVGVALAHLVRTNQLIRLGQGEGSLFSHPRVPRFAAPISLPAMLEAAA